MKKLVCAKEVQAAAATGKTSIAVDAATLITPSAKDIAKELGIAFVEQQMTAPACEVPLSGGNIDRSKLFELVKAVMLGQVDMGAFAATPAYTAQQDAGGLKIVQGKSVRMDTFDTGNPADRVKYQEIIHKEQSHMSAGFLEIDHSAFAWELAYEEIDLVLEGTLCITVNGQTRQAGPGDVVFVPKGAKVTWGSKDQYAKLFYVTYPANWPDLTAAKK